MVQRLFARMPVTMCLLHVHGKKECLVVGPVCDMGLPRFQQGQYKVSHTYLPGDYIQLFFSFALFMPILCYLSCWLLFWIIFFLLSYNSSFVNMADIEYHISSKD